MKVAVIGSRSIISFALEDFLPEGVTEIVSGGAKGVDTVARNYANANGLLLTEFLPDYKRFGRVAPLKRNDLIVEYADMVLAFWDGKSTGTEYVIKKCKALGKPIKIFRIKQENGE